MKLPHTINLLTGYKDNIILLLLSIFFGAIGQLLMKAGANNAEISSLGELLLTVGSPLVILGLLSYSLASGIWLIILTRLPLSMAYPFGAISYILIFIGSALSGEYIHPARYLGVISIMVGILIIGSTSNNLKA